MYLWKNLGYISAVAMLAGVVYAGDGACCGESRSEVHAAPAVMVGNPCSTCEEVCEPRCKAKCCKIDADIERFRVINPKCSTDLCVEYTVDIECQPSDEFDLLVQVKCEDQILFERIVPLENGEPGNETGEFTYHGAFSDSLCSILTNRGKLRAEANVVQRGTTISLDRERESVHRTSRGHGLATPLYSAGEVLYTPVGWMSAR